MQDEDKFRERIQIMLDNRQIFLIFLASSVILALVFSLGFVVGKRSSTKSLAPPPSDTLALLDKMNVGEEEEEDPLTFHEALTGDQIPEGEAEAKAKAAAAREAAAQAEAAKAEAAAKVLAVANEAAAKAEAARVLAAANEAAKPDSPAALKVGVGTLPMPVGQVVKDEPAKDEPANKGTMPADDGDYTLQLSAFQDKNEAAQFVASLKQSGYLPYMQSTTIPGKGVWFRVRMGTYKTWDDAVVAKQQFEAKKQIIAYVTKK